MERGTGSRPVAQVDKQDRPRRAALRARARRQMDTAAAPAPASAAETRHRRDQVSPVEFQAARLETKDEVQAPVRRLRPAARVAETMTPSIGCLRLQSVGQGEATVDRTVRVDRTAATQARLPPPVHHRADRPEARGREADHRAAQEPRAEQRRVRHLSAHLRPERRRNPATPGPADLQDMKRAPDQLRQVNQALTILLQSRSLRAAIPRAVTRRLWRPGQSSEVATGLCPSSAPAPG